MKDLPSTPLHELLGAADLQWNSVVQKASFNWLCSMLTLDEAREMHRTLWAVDDWDGENVAGLLEDFSRLPPTVLLGAYDLMRWSQAVHAYMSELSDG